MKYIRALSAGGLALALAFAGAGTVPAAAATAPGGEATLAAPPHQTPHYTSLQAAGSGLQFPRGFDGTIWWRSPDGRETSWNGCDGRTKWSARYGDSTGCELSLDGGSDTPGPLRIHDFATDKTETLASQANRVWTSASSPTQVLTYEIRTDGWLDLHLLGREGDPRKDVPVKATEKIARPFKVESQDTNSALVSYMAADASDQLAVVDFAAGTMRTVAKPAGVTDLDHVKVALGARWIALQYDWKATLISRANPAVTHTLDLHPNTLEVRPVGDWLVSRRQYLTADAVVAAPINGGAQRTLLPRAGEAPLVSGSDGAVYADGGTDSTHWGVQRIVPDALGVPQVTEALHTPPNPADRKGLAFAQGQLAVGQDDPNRSIQGYQASVSGPVSVSRTPGWSWNCDAEATESVCAGKVAGDQFAATGDGRLVGLATQDGLGCYSCVVVARVKEARTGGAVRFVRLESANPMQATSIVAASGRYLLFVASENSAQRLLVADIETGKVLGSGLPWASALWGSMLWQPEGDKGVVAGTDLRTGQVTRRLDLGSGCRPYELAVSGDWFYSTCSSYGDAAAAYHVPDKKRIPMPFTPEAGSVRLGDGYVARNAEVYNLRSGTAVREFAPEQPPLAFGVDWTIDRFGGPLAYIDPAETVHVVGITGAASALAVIDQSAPATWDAGNPGATQPRWWLSKPAGSWQLSVRDKATGITTPVRSGAEARGLVAPGWDGRDAAGKLLENGAYDWTLTAKPADGQGGDLTVSGAVTLSGGAAGPRDHVGDGFGDLLGFKADGTAEFRPGGGGAFGAAVPGSGWTGENTITAVVPFADVDGDGCNDVLARTKAGALRAYRPGCGKPLTPASPYSVIGSGGWNAYDTLVSPGDITGDGRPDLLARNNTTGQLYSYELKGTALLPKKLVAEGMQGYLLAGARDLNGDGRGDMVGRDPAGKLWFYPGQSDGKLAPRVEIGGGWQVFDSLVGVGDITGDGRADLVARDKAGVLWRYNGRGNGKFDKAARIGDGWGRTRP